MKRIPVTRTALAAAAALVGLVLAADAAPGDGPGWTGITNPKDVINAREELMEEIEHVMQPIDTFELASLVLPGLPAYDLRSLARFFGDDGTDRPPHRES